MSVSSRLLKQSRRLPAQQPLPWGVFFRQILGGDAVLWIALALALVSSLVVMPRWTDYAGFIDAKTLACLFCLMVASGGFMLAGLFDFAAARLVGACRTARSLVTVMVLVTFFSSMLITNDVALIVLVPMTLLAFSQAALDPMPTVVLQTVAANVGSMLLPTGNPQNLFLFSFYRMHFIDFFLAVLPLSLAGFALLFLCCVMTRKDRVRCAAISGVVVRKSEIYLYLPLFILAGLAVFDVVSYDVVTLLALVIMVARGRNLIQQVDYALLLTFVGFFIFVGNIASVPQIAALFERLVGPRPFLAAVAASQVVSNVPAALLLSNFTADGYALLAGVSAGGCGTLIASMASLISYKLYVRSGGNRARFLLRFTVVNLVFLALLAAVYYLSA